MSYHFEPCFLFNHHLLLTTCYMGHTVLSNINCVPAYYILPDKNGTYISHNSEKPLNGREVWNLL